MLVVLSAVDHRLWDAVTEDKSVAGEGHSAEVHVDMLLLLLVAALQRNECLPIQQQRNTRLDPH